MIGRSWLCGLLTVIILTGGCGESTKKGQMETEMTGQETRMIEQETKIAKMEKNMAGSGTKMVKFETSMGDIVVELDEKAAPLSVRNFLRYVNEGFYDGVIFHRVIPNFMIQGGGFTVEMEKKATHDPIVNEADNGLSNVRGSIAMARTNMPDSATSQFFINHKDNGFLNYVDESRPGYAVFGKVIEGMDVVDKIASVKTTKRKDKKGDLKSDVPVEPVVIKSAKVISK
jgi:cyclophilin family peptidyl-prolyl cis-trans isomerase